MKEQLDCLLSVVQISSDVVKKAGRRVPQDLGLAQLNRDVSHVYYSGVVADTTIQGKLASQRLHSLLLANESGIPEVRIIQRTEGIWEDGPTTRWQDANVTL